MFGLRLKEFRLQKGLSQEHLAEKMYVVRQTISKWENGLSFPSAEQLIILTKLLEVPLDVLLGINDDLENERPTASEPSELAGNCPVMSKKEEMIAGITSRLEGMNEAGVASLFEIIMLIPIKERWRASTSQERIAELEAIASQRRQEEALEKEKAAKEAKQMADAKREQIYHDYARMFNAIKKVKIPIRYDLSLGEIQAIDFVCGGIRRYFPEYAFSVACKHFDYGFVKGMRYATAQSKKK